MPPVACRLRALDAGERGGGHDGPQSCGRRRRRPWCGDRRIASFKAADGASIRGDSRMSQIKVSATRKTGKPGESKDMILMLGGLALLVGIVARNKYLGYGGLCIVASAAA